MESSSLARVLSQFRPAQLDVWDYREDLQNLAAFLADGANLEGDAVLPEAVAGLDIYRGELSIRVWLHRVISKERLTREMREAEDLDVYLDRAVSGHPQREMRGPLLQAELLARRHILDTFAALPDRYRAVILLKDGHGLTVNQTALLMDTTPAAVRSLLYRARSHWRQPS